MKINKDPHHNHEDVHDHNKEVTKETMSYWRHMMQSTRKAMSIGAQNILKAMSWAHGNNWRRRDKKK